MDQKKILIIEDEPNVAGFLRKGLEEQDFEVQVAYDGKIGLRMALNGEFDVIIMDVNLPGMNGYEISRQLRSANNQAPVLMLTALGTMDDKLSGFDAGADDYLVKPFEFRELLARIRSLLKRGRSETGNILKVDDLEIHQDSKTVKRGNKKIELTGKEYALLEYLVKNKNRVVSRADIAEKIWDITFETGTNIIDVYVNFLRKKVDKDFPTKLIHTRTGMGYMLKEGEG